MKTTTAFKVIGVLILAGVLVGCAPKKASPSKPTAATEQALKKAEQCIAQAKQIAVTVDQAQQTLDQAQQAAKVPNDQKAQDLANQVCQQTSTAINDSYLQKARTLAAQAKEYTNLDASQQAQIQQGENGIANARGKVAYDALSGLVSQLKSASVTYTVVSGDSLWAIAGKASAYSNPYEWPLIYYYNSKKINDPDRIYPNEQLTVPLHPTKSEVASAMNYAKTRGPWQNGQALQKDHSWIASLRSMVNASTGGSAGGT